MGADELALLMKGEADETPDRRTDWWAEARGILWLVLAVLGFHSLVAKPFYIPSESMMPALLKGDRLVVTKYPYGFSFVTPTFHLLPPLPGRLLGRMPERGDVVIVTPPGSDTDYIKRVIGLPGDRVAVVGGLLYLNGRQVPRVAAGFRLVPVDANTLCEPSHYPAASQWARTAGAIAGCRSIARPCRAGAPTTRSTWGPRASPGDDYPERRVPKGQVFLMGDNRDNSADSRYSFASNGLGGPVPWENIGGRAEFITFSLDGSAGWNPLTWFGSFRPGRAGTSLHAEQAPQ